MTDITLQWKVAYVMDDGKDYFTGQPRKARIVNWFDSEASALAAVANAVRSTCVDSSTIEYEEPKGRCVECGNHPVLFQHEQNCLTGESA